MQKSLFIYLYLKVYIPNINYFFKESKKIINKYNLLIYINKYFYTLSIQ